MKADYHKQANKNSVGMQVELSYCNEETGLKGGLSKEQIDF